MRVTDQPSLIGNQSKAAANRGVVGRTAYPTASGAAAGPGEPSPPPGAAPPARLVVETARKLWDLYADGYLTFDEWDQAMLHLAASAPAYFPETIGCQSCHRRRAMARPHGFAICGKCANDYCTCPGCEQDRGWDAYKEAQA